MNLLKISPDDPRLTAYALGELEGDERAAFEAALRRDPAARALVEEIRATLARLQSALAEEAAADARHLGVRRAPGQREAAAREEGPSHDEKRRAKIFQFPQFYYVVSGLAAACFALFVALQPPAPKGAQTRYSAVPIVAAGKAEGAAAPQDPPASASTTDKVPEAAERPEVMLAVAPEKAQREEFREPPAPPTVVTGVPARVDAVANLAGGAGPAERQPLLPPETFSVSTPAFAAGDVARATEPGTPRAIDQRTNLTSDEVVTLSPFEVSVARDKEPLNSLLAGSRVNHRAERAAKPTAPRGARFTDGNEPERAADNEFLPATEYPLSSIAPEVEIGSYVSAQRAIEAGRLPPRDAVRIEEMLNYFPYRYAPPTDDTPFAAHLTVTEAPWAPEHRLVRIALKGREAAEDRAAPAALVRPSANLVFLIDVSASMYALRKLGTAQESIRRLVTRLRPDDRVGIVTYSGSEGVVLPSLPASRGEEIEAALQALRPNGDTGGVTGLRLAYNVARANLVPNGINRVILCTDDDFNLGVENDEEMFRLVANRAQFGIGLSVLAFGVEDDRPSMVARLAALGQGRCAYVESRSHADRLLAMELESAVTAIAEDVKIEVEFNPAKVARYRLIGYENPRLPRADFNHDSANDRKIFAGHAVTALYEIVPVGVLDKPKEAWAALEDLRYGHLRAVPSEAARQFDPLSKELLTVKVRYQKPDGLVTRKLEFPVTDGGARFADASGDFKFAAAVAGFGMILRNSPHRGTATIGDVIAWAAVASANQADDPGGYRRDFVGLARQAQTLLR